MKDFKIGSEVWFNDPYGNLSSGHIVETELKLKHRIKIEAGHGTQFVRTDRCYESKEELLSAMQEQSDKTISEMLKSIQSVEDLVQFMYDNTVSCAEEYTNWDARKAANIAANRLLGIDLENSEPKQERSGQSLGKALDNLESQIDKTSLDLS